MRVSDTRTNVSRASDDRASATRAARATVRAAREEIHDGGALSPKTNDAHCEQRDRKEGREKSTYL